MTTYPRTLTGDEISPRLRAVVATLAEYLIDGSTPSHKILLEQYSRAQLREVKLSGAGFEAKFEVPDDVARVQPARLLGGRVSMDVQDVLGGAGSILCVLDGRIHHVEVYLYGNAPWPDDPIVLSYLEPEPIAFPAPT
jgi:hypothetical protein